MNKEIGIIILLLMFIATIADFNFGSSYARYITYKAANTKIDTNNQIIDHVLTILSSPISHRSIKYILNKYTKENTISWSLIDFKPIYYQIENIGNNTVSPKIIFNDRDWTTIDGILNETVKNAKSDEEKAINIYTLIKENTVHDIPSYDSIEEYQPIKFLNIWGYGLCNNTAIAMVILSEKAGLTSRVVKLSDHIVAEVYYQNRWHMFDSDYKLFIRKEDGNIASVQEIKQDPSLIDGNLIFLDFETIQSYKKFYINMDRVKYLPIREFSENFSEITYPLRKEETIRFYYSYKGKYFRDLTNPDFFDISESDKYRQPKIYSNGFIISPSTSQTDNNFYFNLPYPILGIYLFADDICNNNKIKVKYKMQDINVEEFSCLQNLLDLSGLISIREGLPTYEYSIQIDNLKEYYLFTQFQVSPISLPSLKYGINKIEFRPESNISLQISFGL